MSETIFCPSCDRFIGQGEGCPHCGWSRPAAPGSPGSRKWSSQAGVSDVPPGTPPFPARFACNGRMAFLCTPDGDVFAIDINDGQVRWRRTIRLDRRLRTLAPVTWRDRLLLGTEHLADLPTHNRALLVWDAESGTDTWSWPTPSDNLSIPLVEGDTAYFTSSEPRLYALDLTARKSLWSSAAPGWSPEPPALSGETLVVPSRGGVAAAFHVTTGRRLWTFQADDPEMESLHQRPAVSDALAFFAGWGRLIYAVDLKTGQERWRFSAERGVTGPMLLAGDLLLVGLKDFRLDGGASRPGYGLYALDAADGTVRWNFPTGKHIYTSPAVRGTVILTASDDGCLYALDLSSGRELWRYTTQGRLRAGPLVHGNQVLVGEEDGTLHGLEWRESEVPEPQGELAEAARMALDGQYVEAARRFGTKGQYAHAAALFLEAGQTVEAAACYLQAEAWEKALPLLRQGGDRAGEARVLARLGQHGEAAALYEALNQLDPAVQEYTAAGRAGHAAMLLWKGGRRTEAASLFSSIHQDDQAAEVLVEDGRHAEAAAIYQRLGKLEEAAGVLAQGGLLAEAAAMNETIGRFAVAAEQYERNGQPELALKLYEQAGDWNQAARLSGAAGDQIRQARALGKAGQYETAARLMQEAGEPGAALEIYETAGRWDSAAALAGELGLWSKQGDLLCKLGMLVEAGDAYQRAARALQEQNSTATSELAGLFESAARCFNESSETVRYTECWDWVCRLRRWPNLKGRLDLEPHFFQGKYGIIELEIRNTGYGTARKIQVTKLNTKFQIDESEPPPGINLLGPGNERTLRLSLMPSPNVLGHVFLRVTLAFEDAEGQPHETLLEEQVHVLDRDEKISPLDLTPIDADLDLPIIPGINLNRLRQGLVRYFNEDDLRGLCFELGVDFEELPGDTKSRKVIELILYLANRDRDQITELLNKCREQRPKVSW